MLDRTRWLTCELSFMQYPEGPPINLKCVGQWEATLFKELHALSSLSTILDWRQNIWTVK